MAIKVNWDAASLLRKKGGTGKREHFTPEQEAQILDMDKRGYTPYAISVYMNVSKWRVRYWLEKRKSRTADSTTKK